MRMIGRNQSLKLSANFTNFSDTSYHKMAISPLRWRMFLLQDSWAWSVLFKSLQNSSWTCRLIQSLHTLQDTSSVPSPGVLWHSFHAYEECMSLDWRVHLISSFLFWKNSMNFSTSRRMTWNLSARSWKFLYWIVGQYVDAGFHCCVFPSEISNLLSEDASKNRTFESSCLDKHSPPRRVVCPPCLSSPLSIYYPLFRESRLHQ